MGWKNESFLHTEENEQIVMKISCSFHSIIVLFILIKQLTGCSVLSTEDKAFADKMKNQSGCIVFIMGNLLPDYHQIFRHVEKFSIVILYCFLWRYQILFTHLKHTFLLSKVAKIWFQYNDWKFSSG